MPKRNLDRTWIYNGKIYVAGPAVELTDEAAAAIDAKMQIAPADEGAHEINPDNLASLHGAPVKPGNLAQSLTEPDRIAPFAESAGLSDTAVQHLTAAGYGTDDAIRAASDDDLLAVEGVGPATLHALRSFYGTVEERPDDAAEGEQFGASGVPPARQRRRG